MNSKEFNAKDNTWFNIKENTKKMCLENDVDFYNYLGSFIKFKLFHYIKNKELIKKINSLDFSDKIKVRAVLNKKHFLSKDRELELAKNEFYKSQKEVFDWLKKTKNPYFFILNPVFKYNTGISYKSWINERHGYIKESCTGIQNLDIACDYAKYILNNK